MSPETSETLDLVLFSESQTSVEVFTRSGMTALLEDIETKVRAKATNLDISTETGRAEIRSLAFQVRKTKVALDKEGQRLTELWRKQTQQVNAERKIGETRLDALAEEVRKPLTEFEEAEKRRVEAHEEALRDMTGMLEMLQAHPDMTVTLLEDHLLDLSLSNINRNWEEFADRAAKTRRDVSVYLVGRIEARKRYEAEQAELARLRAEEAERQRVETDRLARERDIHLQAEAAEAARLQAERLANERAAEERQRVAAEAERVRLEMERQQREAEDRAEIARQAIEDRRLAEQRARIEAEHRELAANIARAEAEKKAEQERLAAEQRLADAKKKAADDARKASEKARKDREEALQRERDKLTAANVAAEIERRRREEDEANKARVHAEIVEDLLDGWNTLEDNAATAIADLIIAGRVRHVRIQW